MVDVSGIFYIFLSQKPLSDTYLKVLSYPQSPGNLSP